MFILKDLVMVLKGQRWRGNFPNNQTATIEVVERLKNSVEGIIHSSNYLNKILHHEFNIDPQKWTGTQNASGGTWKILKGQEKE